MRTTYIHGFSARMAVILFLAAAMTGFLGAQTMSGGAKQSAPNQVSAVGTINAITGTTLFVATPDNAVQTVVIGPKSLILGRNLVSLDSIKPGEALGVAATMSAEGVLTATVINIFTKELWQNPLMRKGQFPMPNGQVMTNAPMEKIGGKVKDKVLYMKYEMLTAAIKVSDSTEIHRMVAKNLAALKVGMKVLVRGIPKPDGSLEAVSVSFDIAP